MSSAPAPEFMGAGRGMRPQAHISAVSGAHGWDALGKISLRRIEVPMAPSLDGAASGPSGPDHAAAGTAATADSSPRRRFQNDLAQYDLDQYATAVAPFGGMIALVPKRGAVALSTTSPASFAPKRDFAQFAKARHFSLASATRALKSPLLPMQDCSGTHAKRTTPACASKPSYRRLCMDKAAPTLLPPQRNTEVTTMLPSSPP